MCFSTACASRPVQPAITACSMAMFVFWDDPVSESARTWDTRLQLQVIWQMKPSRHAGGINVSLTYRFPKFSIAVGGQSVVRRFDVWAKSLKRFAPRKCCPDDFVHPTHAGAAQWT